MFKRISEKAQIQQVDTCPIKINDCTILRDKVNNSRYLQLELENDSGKTLASLNIFIKGFDKNGDPLIEEEHNFYTHRNYRGTNYRVEYSGDAIVIPEETVRVSVHVVKVLAYRCGDHGEIIDITDSSTDSEI